MSRSKSLLKEAQSASQRLWWGLSEVRHLSKGARTGTNTNGEESAGEAVSFVSSGELLGGEIVTLPEQQ